MFWIRLIVMVIIPPIGVFLTVGLRGAFWLNLLLTLFFYIPGLVHGVYILTRSLPPEHR
ncbi:uncharacterized membrane protein YqaE (UPF0057 family) [Loktanella ponticola]|uniref:Uncharacterized membrane protein YqaE (UPF0057 family) n=1 Tax=Yoonia ponticola TaxID=1524255 RepID=A0A7W9EXE4_9RHOB|nr:YqaE/Pmp3 family membrane protein [Yoonia ponticola]MBB5721613.1 uncharacterized membrane protein YqaE (UPF0057 family) [Yoonia ponticola]